MKNSTFPNPLDLGIIFVTFLISSVVFSVPQFLLGESANGTLVGNLGLLFSAGGSIIFTYYVAYLRAGRPSIDWGLNRFDLRVLLLGTLLAASLASFISILYIVFGLNAAMEEYMRGIMANGWGIVIAATISAPLFEELICRHLLMGGYLEKGITPWKAILFSAAFFGLLHLHPLHVLPAFLIGVALGYVYYRTGSLATVIGIHFLNNAIATTLMQLDIEDPVQLLIEASGAAIGLPGLGLGSLLLAYACYSVIRRLTEGAELPLALKGVEE